MVLFGSPQCFTAIAEDSPDYGRKKNAVCFKGRRTVEFV